MLPGTLSGLVVVLLDLATSVLSEGLDPSACLQLGFNPAKLLCSACVDLKQFDLTGLSADCEKCCVRDAGSAKLENTKYSRAILEVCG